MDTRVEFLYLNEPDMIKAGVKDMRACIEAMEEMLLLVKRGDYRMGGENHNSHGCMVTFPDHPEFPGMPANTQDRRFMAMPAYLGGSYQMAGVKWYGSNVENRDKGLPRSILTMMLNDKDTGAPLAFMSANLLSAYRTGGIPGVGAKYLARQDSRVAAIIGPGVMGKTSLAAFAVTCPELTEVRIKGRGQRSIESFIEFVHKDFPGIREIKVCDTLEEAVTGADLISFTTTALNSDDPAVVETYPYLKTEWIKPGAFIAMPSAGRFDDSLLTDPHCRLIVDNRMLYDAWATEYPYPTFPKMGIIGCKFTDLMHEGQIESSDIIDITEIIDGTQQGRLSDDDIVIYSVGGMPVEDIAWGCSVYRRAKELGIGTTLTMWDTPEMA